MLKDLLLKNRSYRTFDENIRPDRKMLLSLVELTRIIPSSSNLQPLKFFVSCEDDTNEKIFSLTRWGGALPALKLPPAGKKPTAFIVVCLDENLTKGNSMFLKDVGIASQTIMLGATELGFGGCMIGSAPPDKVRDALGLAENIIPSLVLAIGKPDETILLEDMPIGGKQTYYRDENGLHHVPKRTLEEILL